MATAPAPEKRLLPDKQDEEGFQKLLFDRHLAFMVMEVVRLREALLGSHTLIKQSELNPKLDFLEPVNIIDAYEELEPGEPLFRHVDNAALGDASLRWAGHLPPVAPFAAEEPEKACPETCGCKGMLMRKDIIHIVKTQYNLDWQPFLDYAQQEHEAENVAVESTEHLRSRLTSVLGELEEIFFEILSEGLDVMGFPHHDEGSITDEHAFYPYLRDTTPLASDIAEGLQSGDVFSYHMDELEQLHQRGRGVRKYFSLLRLEIGKELRQRAAKYEGVAFERMIMEAHLQFLHIRAGGDLYAILAMQETTAILLEEKNYSQASIASNESTKRCLQLNREPNKYKTFRSLNVQAFQTGELPRAPSKSRRMRKVRDIYFLDSVTYRSQCQAAEAEVGLARIALRGTGAIANLEAARLHRKEATTYAQKAQDIFPEHTQDLGIDDLTELFTKRLKTHLSLSVQKRR